ncbi:MAG: rod shape-determining protein MreC, partial [Candidatus Puniceispirillaceae bacterium]
FLPLEAEPKENELVLTSGHGEILPPGLPVGRVVKGAGREYYIQPVVDLRKVAFVSILVRPQGETPGNISGFADFFTPLPESDNKRLLEGFSTKDVLQ